MFGTVCKRSLLPRLSLFLSLAFISVVSAITAEPAKRAAAIASFKATDLPIALQCVTRLVYSMPTCYFTPVFTAFRRFEKVLMENDGGAGWFVGSGVTVADLTVFQYCDYVVTL